MCDEQGWHLTLHNAAGNDSNTASHHHTTVLFPEMENIQRLSVSYNRL